jgi:uncharacterized protein (TIGR02594 family)
VIIEFFRATRLNPLAPDNDGDQTPWCAAFLNWCIARGHSKDGNINEATLAHGTNSASSGSFRCWANETKEPKPGDIVVWAEDGTVKPCERGILGIGRGHVAFYLGSGTGERLLVVGGNQRSGLPGQSGITATEIPRRFLRRRNGVDVGVELNSVRTVDGQ